MLKGNKGEWSEIYVLLRLLADGKIYAADSELNKLEDIFFPIIKIIREEVTGEVKEYFPGRYSFTSPTTSVLIIFIIGKNILSNLFKSLSAAKIFPSANNLNNTYTSDHSPLLPLSIFSSEITLNKIA